jgi:hypothetical protein
MHKPAVGIGWRDHDQDMGDGAIKNSAGPSLGHPQGGFDLRPTGLDRREIRRVGRQVQQTRATASQGLLDPHSFMGTQIIHHNDIPWVQRRAQPALHMRPEDLRVGCAIDSRDCLKALDAKCAQHGDILSIILGYEVFFAGQGPSAAPPDTSS